VSSDVQARCAICSQPIQFGGFVGNEDGTWVHLACHGGIQRFENIKEWDRASPSDTVCVSIFSRMGPRLFRSMGPLGPGPSRDRVQGWPGPGWPTAGRFYVGSAGDATPFFAGRGAGAKRRGPTRLVERELDAGP
jgi:hypothetical protein